MKKIFLLLVLCSCFIFAADENKKISISLKDRPVYELFEELKEKASFQIVYSKEMLVISGKPVTINVDLKDTEAGLILEVASRAAGFTYEKKGSIYIILPVVHIYAAQQAVPAPASEKDTPKSDEPEKTTSKGSGNVEIIGEKPLPEKLTKKRYAGNFMFGQGNKIYLNLVIPRVTAKEEERITLDMKRACKDGSITKEEAQRLFGHGTEITGKELTGFLKLLHKETLKRLSDDGKLIQKEINELRNDFINQILNTYEEQ